MSALDVIQTADRDMLISRWQEAFKCEPPSRLYIGLLRGVLAWHAQCEACDIHSSAVHTLNTSHDVVSMLRPGTRLLREWRGATHEVLVVAHGFEHAGKTYKSLSAIARAITGTPWSGPAFFGTKR
jgi:hypothetical protein